MRANLAYGRIGCVVVKPDYRFAAVLMISVLLAVVLVWMISIRSIRDRYVEQHFRIALTASNALRLGHEAQRALSVERNNNGLTAPWRRTHHLLTQSVDELLQESHGLPHSDRTETLMNNTVRAWDVVERKIGRADRALRALMSSSISHLVHDRSIRRTYYRSLEYPHNLNGQLVFFTGRAARSFEELALSAEIFEIAVGELLVAVATEASVVQGRIRTAIWMVAFLSGILAVLALWTFLSVSTNGKRPGHSRRLLLSIDNDNSPSAKPASQLLPRTLPHWLSHAIEEYRSLPRLVEGKEEFIALTGRSSEHVARIVKQELSVSLSDFLNQERLRRAIVLLEKGDETICTISKSVGFHNESYFYRCFRSAYGVTPAQYRKRKAAERCPAVLHDTSLADWPSERLSVRHETNSVGGT